LVPANINISLARELVEDIGSYREEEMEDPGSEASSSLSEVESKEGKESQWEEKDNGQPNFKRAVPGAGKEQSMQEFFQHGNGNEVCNDDNIFATPGKQIMRGALAHSLSAATPSTKNAEPVSPTTTNGRMLQLREKGVLCEGIPPAQESTSPMEEAIPGSRSHVRRRHHKQ